MAGNGFIPGLTPGLFLQQARYNNGLDPSSYDPDNFVDPYAAVAMQQQMAQKIFQMQNPRMALPQQFGAALGGMAQQLMRPTDQNQAPQQQGGQPQSPEGQALHLAAVKLKQSNPAMPFNEALYKAADQMEEDPQYGDSPTMQKVLDHARDWAKKNGYNPNFDREEETRAKYKEPINLKLPTGKIVTAQPGSPELKAYLEAGAVKAGEQPQIAVGQRREGVKNGLITEEQWDGQKWVDVRSSYKPVDRSMAVQGTPEQMSNAWGNSGAPQSWGDSSAAKATEDLTNRTAATRKFLDTVDQLKNIATPNSIGNPQEINEKINNVRATISTLGSQLGVNPGKFGYPKSAGKLIDSFRQYGIDSEKVKSLMLMAAMQQEAIEGPKDSTDANRKFAIEQRMEMLGEKTSDPEAFLQTLGLQRDRALRDLHTEFQSKSSIAHMDEPEWLKRELGSKGQKNTPAEGARGKSKSGKPIVFKNGNWHYDTGS